MKTAKKIRQSSPASREHAAYWLRELDGLLRRRCVREGFALLDSTEPKWGTLQAEDVSKAGLLLMLAQWVDVGYRDAEFLRAMLGKLSVKARLQLNVVDYVRVRCAEAFYSLAVDQTSEAIAVLDTILRLDAGLLDTETKLLAHVWRGRAHRKDADYLKAAEDINEALALANAMSESAIIRAVLQVQQGWITFQLGDVPGALAIFSDAESVLKHTDHSIALGNIESARGRIVRRNGDYVRALDHFLRAVAFYETHHPHHANLARAVTNLAFVKRMLALQIKRHIDSAVSNKRSHVGSKDGTSLRALHKQYQELYRSAIAEFERAESICRLNNHPLGLGTAMLNAAYLHLDVGELDLAEKNAKQAYEIGESIQLTLLMARGKIVLGLIENARVEELLGHPGDVPVQAQRARQLCQEAIVLAGSIENKRLIINAQLALGEVACNNFFRDYDLARRCIDTAAAMIGPREADYVVDELNLLKTKVLRAAGIDDKLRAWSEGLVAGRTLQQVMEDFAEMVVTKMWLREGQRTARVAAMLATSPKKVRRLVRHADDLNRRQKTKKKP